MKRKLFRHVFIIEPYNLDFIEGVYMCLLLCLCET